MKLKDKVKWYGIVSGVLFIGGSTYLHVKFVFESGNVAQLLYLSTTLAALLTLVLGVLSFPRWQSFVALTIFVYAVYWLSQPAYAIP
jgi:hypothetical protein